MQPVAESTPAPAPAPAPAPSPACQPGTMEYASWFSATGGSGSCAEWWAEKLEEEAKAKEEEELTDWFEGSPTGFGSDGF